MPELVVIPDCSIQECDRPQYARQLCEIHYHRLIKTGRLGGPIRASRGNTDPYERIMAKLVIGPVPAARPDLGPCHLRRGGNPALYWQVYIEGRVVMAHRYLYGRRFGFIDPSLDIDHLCRVRGCVNTDHLEPVTVRVNVQRGARASSPTCKRGHPFDEANTFIRPDGSRKCRKCDTIRHQKYAMAKVT